MRRLIPLFLLLFPLLSFATIIPIAERPISPVVIPPGPTPAADDPVVVYADYGLRAGLWRTFAVAGATQPVAPRKLWSGDVQWLTTCRTNSGTLVAWQSGTQLMTAVVDDRGELLAAPRVVDGAGVTPQGLGWDGRRALLVSARATPFVEIYATVLDASGAAIAPAVMIQLDQHQMATSFIGTTAVVAVDNTFIIFFRDIVASRVTDDGVLLDPTPKTIVTPHLSINFFGAAYDGKEIAVVLHDGAGSQFAIRRVLVDPSTLAVRELPSIATAHLWSVGVVWNGSEFVAYWTADAGDGVDLTTLRFTADEPETPAVVGHFGPEAHAFAILTAHDLRFLAASFPPASMQFVVTDRRGLTPSAAVPVIVSPLAQRFTALAPGLVVWGEYSFWSSDSTVLWARTDNGIAVPISGAADMLATSPPQAVFTGSTWFVVWSEVDPTTYVYSIKARRIGLDGRPLDAAPLTIGTPLLPSFGLATDGATIVVVTHMKTALTGFRFDANGNALDPVVIAATGDNPRIASNGRGFFVAWNEGENLIMNPAGNGLDVVGARLDASGSVIDTTPIAIATRKADEYAPHVASNGADYLVTWTIDITLIGQRVDANGTLDGAPQTIADDVRSRLIALSGDAVGYWAAWNDGFTDRGQLEVARLDAFGTPVDRGIVAPMTDTIPSLLAGNNGAIVAYGRFDSAVEAPRVFSNSIVSHPIRPHAARR